VSWVHIRTSASLRATVRLYFSRGSSLARAASSLTSVRLAEPVG